MDLTRSGGFKVDLDMILTAAIHYLISEIKVTRNEFDIFENIFSIQENEIKYSVSKGQVKIYFLITRARKHSKTLERWNFLL